MVVYGFPNPEWLAKGNGECIYAKAALERLRRLRSHQIKHAHVRSFLLREDRAVASASWQKLSATGTPYRVQVRSQPLDRFRVRVSTWAAFFFYWSSASISGLCCLGKHRHRCPYEPRRLKKQTGRNADRNGKALFSTTIPTKLVTSVTSRVLATTVFSGE